MFFILNFFLHVFKKFTPVHPDNVALTYTFPTVIIIIIIIICPLSSPQPTPNNQQVDAVMLFLSRHRSVFPFTGPMSPQTRQRELCQYALMSTDGSGHARFPFTTLASSLCDFETRTHTLDTCAELRLFWWIARFSLSSR